MSKTDLELLAKWAPVMSGMLYDPSDHFMLANDLEAAFQRDMGTRAELIESQGPNLLLPYLLGSGHFVDKSLQYFKRKYFHRIMMRKFHGRTYYREWSYYDPADK
jgi:hypothetical protein